MTVDDGAIDDPAAVDRGDACPTVVEDVSREDFVRYAGASGDFYAVHYDDEYARANGFPRVFGQGMFTAGLGARKVAEWVGVGRVREYRVRFTDQLWPGDTVVVSGEIESVNRTDGLWRIAGDVRALRRSDDDILLEGRVVAELPVDGEEH